MRTVKEQRKIGYIEDSIYPLIIIRDRYTGVYSGGKYTAWNVELEEIPTEIEDSDVPCRNFWYEQEDNPTYIVGKGDTVKEALTSLYVKLKNNEYKCDKNETNHYK